MGEFSEPEDFKVTVAALVRKRRDVAFEAKRAELVHIDSVLRMFAPDLPLDAISLRQRSPRRLDYFAHGEISRRALDMIRAGGTVTALDIVKRAMEDKGLSFDSDRHTRIEFGRRITMRLNDMARKGQVEKVGFGCGMHWKLA